MLQDNAQTRAIDLFALAGPRFPSRVWLSAPFAFADEVYLVHAPSLFMRRGGLSGSAWTAAQRIFLAWRVVAPGWLPS